MISNYAKFEISGNSIPTKKTHHVTGHSPSMTTGMIYRCIESTEKAGTYNTTCMTVIMESKQ